MTDGTDSGTGGQGRGGAAEPARGGGDWRVVDRTLRQLARRRVALDVEEAALLRRARAAGVHRHFGFATFAEYVERALGYAPGVARERMRVADALAALPKMRAAMTAGDLAYSAARELTRVATVDTEDKWLAAAAKQTVRQIEDLVSGRRPGDLPGDLPDPNARLHEVRFLVTSATLGKYTATRRAEEDSCGHPLTDDEVLAALCDSRLAGAGDGAPPAERPLYQIAITKCADCGQGWHDVAGKTIAISPTDLAQAACDADLLGRVDGDKLARVTRSIPPKTRRAVVRRDRGRCVVPGCRNARYVQVHHLVHRAKGGTHAASGLACLCSAHHRAAHDGRLKVERDLRGRLRFSHGDGRPYGVPPPQVGEAREPVTGETVPRTAPHVKPHHRAPPAPTSRAETAAGKVRDRRPRAPKAAPRSRRERSRQ